MANEKTSIEEAGLAALKGIRPSGDHLDVMDEPTPEEAAAIREEKIARFTQVLDRGILNDKLGAVLKAATPPGRRGKFVRDREEDIIRYTNLNFTFDVNEKASGLHGSGDKRVRVGDLVVMTIAEEDYQILEEIRRRTVRRKIGSARQEYKNLATTQGAAGIEPFDESHTEIG